MKDSADAVCPLHGTVSTERLNTGAYLCTDPAWARHAWERLAWHEFEEDVDDASMCVCGVPAMTHDQVFPPNVCEVCGRSVAPRADGRPRAHKPRKGALDNCPGGGADRSEGRNRDDG